MCIGGPPVHQEGATLQTGDPDLEPRTRQDSCMVSQLV